MNKLKSITPNRLSQSTEVTEKFKGKVKFPNEVREDEAHLTHLAIIKTTPNSTTMEFEHTLQVVKLNEEALEATKHEFARMAGSNTLVVLHDGRQWLENEKQPKEPTKEELEAKEEEAKQAEEKAKLDAEKDKTIKEQADKIAAFEKKEKEAEEARKEAEEKAKISEGNETNTEEASKENTAKSTKSNGKG